VTMVIHKGDYQRVLDDVEADLIFTSPPYNIGSRYPRTDGQRKHGNYDPKSYGAITDYPDSLPESEYQDQQRDFFLWAADHLKRSGTLVYNHKPRRRNGAMIHPAEWFLRPEVSERLVLMEEIIWDRGSTHNHGRQLMWPHTERLYVFRRAEDRYALDNTGRLDFRSDLWRIPLSSRTNGHNAPFALALAEAVISAWSQPGDLVCDPYAGSGTTAVAARRLGRAFEGAERLAKYHALAMEQLA
jgi:site-specific DNA-methyltransferase (adenine-specific)